MLCLKKHWISSLTLICVAISTFYLVVDFKVGRWDRVEDKLDKRITEVKTDLKEDITRVEKK